MRIYINNILGQQQISTITSYPPVRAFTTAVGYGRNATGGRGGQVIKVTNLNSSGPGSLREALVTTGPRIIVFDVSGVINLTSMPELTLANSDFTVAGQTAPEGGITITGRPIQMGGGWNQANEPCNNGIWRYIRFRNGNYTGVDDVYYHNGFVSSGSDGLVFDHCSFSFCDDQAISMRGSYGALKNITIQNCVFSENATCIVAGYDNSYDTGDMTIMNNLFIDQSYRLPNIDGNLRYDILNNYVFNHTNRLTIINGGTPEVNYIGNYIHTGYHSNPSGVNRVQSPALPNIYTADNYHNLLHVTPELNDQDMWQDFYTPSNPVNPAYFTTTQHPFNNDENLLGAFAARTSLLSDVGNNKYLNLDGSVSGYIDSFDTTKINNASSYISSNPENTTWVQPSLPSNTKSGYDTLNDGIPDVWKVAKGHLATDDLTSYIWPSGYVGIEEYLNEIDN